MSSKNCLNCGHELTQKYCANCGQKADTHRITVRHFIAHDMIHGVFHLDKGIIFTIKETFKRPGKAAMDYISGKRISYYNIFYLIVLLLGLNFLIQHYVVSLNPNSKIIKADGDGLKYLKFFQDNAKYIILSFIPLFALNAWLLFWRAKLNIAEHHILSGFVLLGCSIIMLFTQLFNFLPNSVLASFVGNIKGIFVISMNLFPLYVYYSAFAKRYTILGFLWRMLFMYLFFFIEFIIGVVVIMGFLTNGSFNGELTL